MSGKYVLLEFDTVIYWRFGVKECTEPMLALLKGG